MNRSLPRDVCIVEVGPRDGLQNEATLVPTDIKRIFIRQLVQAGLKQIEATSFVNPQAVPQLSDADQLFPQLSMSPGVIYSALVPNEKGFQRAVAAGVKRIALFTAASETFVKNNIRMSIDESLAVFAPIVRDALRQGLSARGYLSTAFVCPFEGDIRKEKVREVTQRLLDIGVNQVAISDTIGAASPKDVFETVSFVLDKIPADLIALHFHDTYGTALANVFAGLQLGISTFDSSAGGLGGCPFAPGAAGNLATEDLVYMLSRMGIDTGVDLEKLCQAATLMSTTLQRELPSRQWKRWRSIQREQCPTSPPIA